MSAYIIFIREETFDPAEISLYWEKVLPTLDDPNMKVLVGYGAHEVLEGSPAEGIALLEFPDSAAAKAWYDSPQYLAARKHRTAGAAYRTILVDGIGLG